MTTINKVFQPPQGFSTSNELKTLSMPELYDTEFPTPKAIIKDLLYPGLYIFAGAPKTGKSFLMAQLAYHIAQGQKLWNFDTQQGSVLYLALEDKFYRLQQRLVRMLDMEVSPKLHMAVSAQGLEEGLEAQLASFIEKHPDIRLVIIDTLQKIRGANDEKINYARDYNTSSKLKAIADRHGICLIVVHHTRKQQADDSFEMISGSNGLFAAADGGIILRKDKRVADKATLEFSGRDHADQLLSLNFERATCTWKLEKAACKSWQLPPDPVLEKVVSFVRNNAAPWCGTAQELIDVLKLESVIKNNSLSRKINTHKEQLWESYGIFTKRGRSGNDKTIELQYLPREQAA